MLGLPKHAWPSLKFQIGSIGSCLLVLIFLVPSECFNIDIKKVWSTGKRSLFGQNVMQYKHDSEKGVYVFSPENGALPELYKCELKDAGLQLQCKMDNIKHTTGQGQVGRPVSYPVLAQARNADSFLMCQQFKSRKQKTTTGEINGVCSLRINENGSVTERVYPDLATTVFDFLEEEKNKNSNNNNNNGPMGGLLFNKGDFFTDKLLESKKSDKQDANSNNNNNAYDVDDEGGTEIAIVLDGSGSIKSDDFQKAKDFISNLITKIWEKCFECEFAVVQYGEVIQTEFNLLDSHKDSRSILDKVQKIQQVGKVTKTASALLHVLNNIFNESHGSSESANKIILVLTDGDIFMDPVNLTTVINDTRMQTIERFSIGVGEAFNKTKAYRELKLIANDEKHVIRVEDYSKLDGLISSLQQKMAGIEGTKGDSLEFDLAEVGFSAHLKDKNTLVLGTVGAFDWSGGMMLYFTDSETPQVRFLSETSDHTKTENYSYLGYSVSTAKGRHAPMYIAGAPRHSNVGKVLVFEKDITNYHLWQTLTGEQLGSYFGHQLCTIDINKDGQTDFLLVGAPFYHIKGEEGRVYLYKLSVGGMFTLVSKLEQPYYSFARFGYSIAEIGDINHDGFQDIAIGAPLEGHLEDPDTFGSVYIYNSIKDDIRKSPSQRIRATDFRQKLQFFGQSVDGGLDITGDGYPDIAVGALGNVLVLQSCPVVKIRAILTFEPNKISVTHANKNVTVNLCFIVIPFNQTELNKSFLDYKMELDVFMEQKRISHEDKTFITKQLYFSEQNCTSFPLTVMPCTYDCFSDIVVKISYALNSNKRRDLPPPVMDFYDQDYTYIKLPYEKDCNNKETCIPSLALTTQVSRNQLVIGYTKDVTVNLSLTNSGDHSYMTNVTLIYPENLLFTLIKPPKNPGVECSAPKIIPSSNSTMTCRIRHPVFRASTETFTIIWQLTEEKFSTSEVAIYYVVNNFNNVSAPLVQKTVLPVRHSFSAVLSVSQANLYVTIPSVNATYEDFQYTFHVIAENPFAAELSLELQVPITLKGVKISGVLFQKQNSTQCKTETQVRKCGNKLNNEETLCLIILCEVTSGREEINITSRLFLQNLKELIADTEVFNVTGEILYNQAMYVNLKEPDHKTQLSITILKPKVINLLPVAIGSSVGGVLLLLIIVVILVKCGFFKRKYKNFDQNEAQ
ncbi:integrin alpha-E [Leptodactylus fuscus]|uniref:integrin alpha-E n=1 Tax=Leptodactylus fuscus TaxID=238119 RepID=UPI003F4ECB47